MKVALFTPLGAVFSGIANALAENGLSGLELLTVQGDTSAAEHLAGAMRALAEPAAAMRRSPGRAAAFAPQPVGAALLQLIAGPASRR